MSSLIIEIHPVTDHEGSEREQRYSFTLSFTSALDGGGWSTPRLGRFTPGMTRYPLYRRLGLPQGRSGRERKTSPPPGFDTPIVQPEASRYTDFINYCLLNPEHLVQSSSNFEHCFRDKLDFIKSYINQTLCYSKNKCSPGHRY
jgi:hypothetical protein